MKSLGVKKYLGFIIVCLTCLVFSNLGIGFGAIVSIHNNKSQIEIQAYSGGGGKSYDDPYLISKPADLVVLMNAVNGGADCWDCYYKLTCNIDMSGQIFSGIGVESQVAFCGNFNGNGYTISNLNIQPSQLLYNHNQAVSGLVNPHVVGVGLFGRLGGAATIENLRIVNSSVNSNLLVHPYNATPRYTGLGIIAGLTMGSNVTIRNCMIGDIFEEALCYTTGPDCHGGIVGIQAIEEYLSGTTLTIENCDTSGYYTGGGYTYCYSIGPSYGFTYSGNRAPSSNSYDIYSYSISNCLYNSDYGIAGNDNYDGFYDFSAFRNVEIEQCIAVNTMDFSFDVSNLSGFNVSAVGGLGTDKPEWYKAVDYKKGLPRLRLFIKWIIIYFSAENGKVQTISMDTAVSECQIEIPEEATIKTDSLPTSTTFSFYNQSVTASGNDGYSIFGGWTYSSNPHRYTATFNQEYYFINFSEFEGMVSLECNSFETSTTKIKINPGDSVNASCEHNNKDYTIIKYEIGRHTVKYKVPKKYYVVGGVRNNGFGEIEINPDVYDMSKPDGGVIRFKITDLLLNYDKLTHGTTFSISPTLTLKSYTITFQ